MMQNSKYISKDVLIGRIAEAQLGLVGLEQPLSDFNRGYLAALGDLKRIIKEILVDKESGTT